MTNSSARAMTPSTGKTILALVATLSLLLTLFGAAAARPDGVLAAGDHCPGGDDGAPAGAVNSASGDASEQNVSITWEGDPGVVTITNNNTTNATIVFCAKGGTGFDGDSKNSGEVTAVVGPAETQTFQFGTEISYFVLYSVTVEPELDLGSITFIKDLLPEGDPGQFRLEIFDRNVTPFVLLDQADGGDGTTASAEGLAAGEYRVRETGIDGTDLANYATRIVCIDNDTQAAVTGTLTGHDRFTFQLGEGQDVTCTATNERKAEEEFGEIEIRKSAADDPEETFAFSASWDTDGFTLTDGDAEFSGDLPAGDSFTVTEELTEEQILAGWSLEDIDCGDAEVDVDGSSVTITVVADAIITCTFTNELEEEDEEEGELEIIKFFCPTVGEDQIFVFGPLAEEPIEFGVQGIEEEEELPSTEGCTLGAPDEEALGATFTITGGDLAEPMVVTTTSDEILTLELAPGEYTIVEEGTGLTADFTIADESDTAVVVFNFEEEEEAEEGRLKILKIYCVGQGDPVFTVVDGDASLGDVDLPAGCASPQPGDATFTLSMGETTTGEFTLGSDGARLIPLEVGTYTLNEVDPNEASSDAFEISADETTTAIVFNFAAEGEQPGGGGPGQGETPREGTQGGNPLPNTATSPIPTGSVPAALLALLMLAGLGAAGYAVRAEAQRRR